MEKKLNKSLIVKLPKILHSRLKIGARNLSSESAQKICIANDLIDIIESNLLTAQFVLSPPLMCRTRLAADSG